MLTTRSSNDEISDVIVVGCGRSGTSMVAGLLASAGYFMGPNLHPPREANPTGFFEGEVVKDVNEALLDPLVGPDGRTQLGSRWLETIPQSVSVPKAEGANARTIRRLVAHRPFAFKDPRFCYTLSAWRPFLPSGTAFVCVFREPGRTVTSLLRERNEAPWLRDVHLDAVGAEGLWNTMYRRVLDEHLLVGRWLFLHYDQVLAGPGVSRLSRHVGTRLSSLILRADLKRSTDRQTHESLRVTYAELCALAEHRT